MVEAIQYANELGRGKWEVSLAKSGRFIRANVGKLEIGGIFQNQVHLILDDDTLSQADWLDIGCYALLEGSTIYSNVPSSVSCNFRADQIDRVKPLIWKSYQALIRQAAGTVKRRTNYHMYHAPGVLAYLREATNQPIPDPDYAT